MAGLGYKVYSPKEMVGAVRYAEDAAGRGNNYTGARFLFSSRLRKRVTIYRGVVKLDGLRVGTVEPAELRHDGSRPWEILLDDEEGMLAKAHGQTTFLFETWRILQREAESRLLEGMGL